MQKLKIKFVDFWAGFDPSNNYFFSILGGSDEVEISDSPDILFFSNFGEKHKNYDCFKVFYSSENERPIFFNTDIALTFDFSNNKKHFRLPLYILHAHHLNFNLLSQNRISQKDLLEWKKRKFCCFIVSNGNSKKRIDFFNLLSSKEHVDSGGKFMNNIGKPIIDKLSFIKQYKFVISFENSSYPGYTTEKILDPMIVNSIPIYWGNPKVSSDFNEHSFINVSNIDSINLIYNKMKEIETDDNLIIDFLQSIKVLSSNTFLYPENLRNFILVNFTDTKIPNANKVCNKIIYFFIEKISTIIYWIKHYTVGHFR